MHRCVHAVLVQVHICAQASVGATKAHAWALTGGSSGMYRSADVQRVDVALGVRVGSWETMPV